MQPNSLEQQVDGWGLGLLAMLSCPIDQLNQTWSANHVMVSHKLDFLDFPLTKQNKCKLFSYCESLD